MKRQPSANRIRNVDHTYSHNGRTIAEAQQPRTIWPHNRLAYILCALRSTPDFVAILLFSLHTTQREHRAAKEDIQMSCHAAAAAVAGTKTQPTATPFSVRVWAPEVACGLGEIARWTGSDIALCFYSPPLLLLAAVVVIASSCMRTTTKYPTTFGLLCDAARLGRNKNPARSARSTHWGTNNFRVNGFSRRARCRHRTLAEICVYKCASSHLLCIVLRSIRIQMRVCVCLRHDTIRQPSAGLY